MFMIEDDQTPMEPDQSETIQKQGRELLKTLNSDFTVIVHAEAPREGATPTGIFVLQKEPDEDWNELGAVFLLTSPLSIVFYILRSLDNIDHPEVIIRLLKQTVSDMATMVSEYEAKLKKEPPYVH